MRQKILRFSKHPFKNEEGATAIEYGLIAALVGVVIIVGLTALGTNLNLLFNNVVASL